MHLIRIPTCRGALARTLRSRAPASGSWASLARLQRRWQSQSSEKPFYVTTPIFYVNACMPPWPL